MRQTDDERIPTDVDQTSSDADQTAADADQSASDIDQTSSDSDQSSSDRDQAAADRDQATSDRAHRRGSGDQHDYEDTRRVRAQSALERDKTSESRAAGNQTRDEIAEQRDMVSAARDLTALARDKLAEALDDEIGRLEKIEDAHGPADQKQLAGVQRLLLAAQQRQRAANARHQAADQRKASAEDREHASRDRKSAARDRAAYARELETADIDDLTGALRRRIGLSAIQREIDRARRTGERLIVAQVNVTGLKQLNDTAGRAAGDDLLRSVVRCIGDEVRSYDLVVRTGGDEFACSLSEEGMTVAAERFKRVADRVVEPKGGGIRFGLAELTPDDTIETLIDRAARSMIDSRP